MDFRKGERIFGIKNIKIIDGDQTYPVTLMNISKKGLSVKSEFTFPTFKAIEIEISIRGKQFKISGSVRWVNENPGKGKPNFKEIGISLITPPEEYLQILEEILNPKQEEKA